MEESAEETMMTEQETKDRKPRKGKVRRERDRGRGGKVKVEENNSG